MDPRDMRVESKPMITEGIRVAAVPFGFPFLKSVVQQMIVRKYLLVLTADSHRLEAADN